MKRPLVAFFVLAYACTWVFTIPLAILWNTTLEQTFAWWMIVFLPAPFGPTIAAVIVTARTRGRAGVRALLGKLVQWRVSWRWYVFALLIPYAIVAVAVLLSGFRADALGAFNPLPGLAIAPIALLVALPFGPLAEELGWRGFAQPRLMKSRGLLMTSVLIGLAWTFWHVPMFWFPGAAIPSFLDVTPWSVGLYALLVTAEACVLTFLYVMTRGSVLLAVIYHATFNTAETIIFRMTAEPTVEQETQVYLITIILTWALAAALLGWLGWSRRRADAPPAVNSSSPGAEEDR